jgi:surfeit locus 1 family protein
MTPPFGRRQLRPQLGMTLAMLPVLAILLALGSWQWQRLQWKEELLLHMQQRITAEPADLPALQPDQAAEAAAWDYRPVRLTGRFRHDLELYLGPRTRPDASGITRSGVHVLTPMIREDGGPAVLVLRGFVPLDRLDPASRLQGQTDGLVTLTGIARLPVARGALQPDNDPAGRRWFWIDLPAMTGATGLASLSPVIVEAEAGLNPGGWPVSDGTRVTLPNNHLAYAGTWFGLALTLVGVWLAASWRYPRQD